jgi:peptidoglycan/xylan/chitin deacetylase (PgdA/CDA1 family)
VRTIAAAGHECALHCHHHASHRGMTWSELEADTQRALELLGYAGVRPRLWRPPYGTRTALSPRVAERHGLELVGWTVDPTDHRPLPADVLLAAIEPRLGPGEIVLLHDGLAVGQRRSSVDATVQLIGPLVEAARTRGLDPAPLP